MASLLVVEDEPNLRALLRRMLTASGYTVATAATGADGLRLALAEDYDLVILDLTLPDLSGEQIMSVLLASRPDTRILVLSSAIETRRRVAVLEDGAADFVAKPFVNGDLLARIRLRVAAATTASPRSSSRLEIDEDAHLDLGRRELIINGHRVALSQREFTLLAHLAEHRGTTCTRQELLADVWGLLFDPRTNVVDVYIGRLRSKLAPLQIETVRNVGYRLAAG